MRNIVKLFTIVFLLAGNAAASQDWNWGENVDKAKENNVLYTDALKIKDYEGALEPLQWLLENTPDLNPSIYINGIKIYEGLAKSASDPTVKEDYIQKGIDLHDKRIEFFPKSKANVTDRKAIFAYKFYSKSKDRYEYLYNLYKESFELNGKKMNSGNLVAYMNMVYKYKFSGGEISDDEVIETYSSIAGALEDQKTRVSDSKKARYDKYLSNVDALLTATKVEISCEWVESRLGPKMTESGDIKIAKKVFDLMIKGKCLDRQLAFDAAQIIQNDEPTFAVAKFLAGKSVNSDNTEEAIKFYEQAVGLTSKNEEKAEMHVNIARIQSKGGQKSSARNSARMALAFNPNHSDAYTLIGDLYYNSFGSGPCFKQISQVEDRLVFIAAYEQYRLAGNTAKMNSAKSQFPSIEDIFNEGKQEGESITVGCWINTTVKLARRPQ